MGYSVVLNEDLLAFSEKRGEPTRLRVDTGEAPGHGIELRLNQVDAVRSVEPWPALQIARHTKHLTGERTLIPPERRFGLGGPTEAQLDHERMVVALIEGLSANPKSANIEIITGWAGWPLVPWTEVDDFPDRTSAGDGAFRTPADPDVVVARRAAPEALERMLIWLATSPDRSPSDTPGEVVLTKEHAYARFAEERVCRLPRESLRARRGPVDDDAVYCFGRRTRLLLTHREGCPVRTELDRQLAERAVAGVSRRR